jgi:hypothetical protein
MRWLVDYLCRNSTEPRWSLAFHHCADEEFAHQHLCCDDEDYTAGGTSTHFAIPIGNDAEYLSLYQKVATKGLDDPQQWHPIVTHLPEMMSIHTGVMYR